MIKTAKTNLPRITSEAFKNSGLRGFGFSDVYQGPVVAEGFDRLQATGANSFRSIIQPQFNGVEFSLDRQQLNSLREILSRAQSRNLYVILGIAIPEALHYRVWTDKIAKDSLVTLWTYLAKLLKTNNTVAAFDILNEPKLFDSSNAISYWERFVKATVAGILTEDFNRAIVVETWPGGRVDTTSAWGPYWVEQPSQVVMSSHCYSPFSFTHKIVPTGSSKENFDFVKTLATLHNELLYFYSQCKKFNTAAYIGEFSAVQLNRGSELWAEHAVKLFNAFGFSWSWHYFIGPEIWHPNESTLKILQEHMHNV